MSIQTSREAITRNTGALMAADAPFFKSIQTRYDTLKAKSSNPHPESFTKLVGLLP